MLYKSLLYYLLEEDGRSLYINNGVISSRGIPTPLYNTPDGWQETAIGWERNQDKHGLVRNYTNPLGFVRDGATILKDAIYNHNIERKLFLLVQSLNLEYSPTNYKFIYRYFYKGEIDLSTLKHDSDKAEVSIMEGGLSKMLRANEGTTYDIPFDDDAVNVRLDGITLSKSGNFIIPDSFDIAKSVFGVIFLLPVSFTNADGSAIGLAFSDSELQDVSGVSFSDVLASENYFARAGEFNTATINARVTGRIRMAFSANDPNFDLKIRLLRSNQLIGNQDDYIIVPQFTPVAGNTYDFDIDITVPLQPNEKLFIEAFYVTLTPGSVNTIFQFLPDSALKLSYDSRKEATYCKAFYRKTLFAKLIEKICGHKEYAVSDLLETDNRVITCGDAIRGIEGATIKTTLADFFTDVDTDLMAGLGIEKETATTNLPPGERVRIETRTRYYDATNPVDLGDAKELEVSFAADIAFNRIKTGWKTPDIEDVNGKYDFNGTQQYTTPITRVSKEYNLVSPYKAGPYEIEITRLNLEGKTTTDNSNDNDLFVMVVDPLPAPVQTTISFVADGDYIIVPTNIRLVEGQRIRITGSAVGNDNVYDLGSVASIIVAQIAVLTGATLTDETNVAVTIEFLMGSALSLKRDAWDNITDPDDFGVPSPSTIFNIDLSPKRKLLRHKRWLASVHRNFETEKIKFQSGDKNTNLKTVLSGETIRENDEVNISDLGQKIFLPFYFDFETKVPVDLVELLEESTNRCFQFTFDGDTYKGFLIKAGLAINTLQPQQFKLLCTPDTDLTPLIQ